MEANLNIPRPVMIRKTTLVMSIILSTLVIVSCSNTKMLSCPEFDAGSRVSQEHHKPYKTRNYSPKKRSGNKSLPRGMKLVQVKNDRKVTSGTLNYNSRLTIDPLRKAIEDQGGQHLAMSMYTLTAQEDGLAKGAYDSREARSLEELSHSKLPGSVLPARISDNSSVDSKKLLSKRSRKVRKPAPKIKVETVFLILAFAFSLLGAIFLPAAILSVACLLTWLIIKAIKGSRPCRIILKVLIGLAIVAALITALGFLLLLLLLSNYGY